MTINSDFTWSVSETLDTRSVIVFVFAKESRQVFLKHMQVGILPSREKPRDIFEAQCNPASVLI